MKAQDQEINSAPTVSARDAEAIQHLRQEISAGKHWYLALLEAIGRWSSAEETRGEDAYRYLVAGEAFDWQLLAERLCREVGSMLPEEEMNALLFQGRPPLNLNQEAVMTLIGSTKYCQYLNYFYGVTVEGALLLAVQDEVHKERWIRGGGNEDDAAEEAHRRIYGTGRAALLQSFRQERGHPQLKSVTLTEMKEFSYWLFKYRLSHCEKAKVASDTKKALDFLKRQWASQGPFGVMATQDSMPNTCAENDG